MNLRPAPVGSASRRARRGIVRVACALAPLAALPLVAGCLGEPAITDRWTRVDLLGANVSNLSTITPGVRESLSVSTEITYRAIVTGYAVADLRVSGTLAPGAVHIAPDAPRETMASDIDQVLANSVSMGRATRAITGWDHLIQHLDLSFAGEVPGSLPDSLAPAGAPVGVFLLVYLGSGQKVERLDGSDTLFVTPFKSSDYQILPIGLTLTLPTAAATGMRR